MPTSRASGGRFREWSGRCARAGRGGFESAQQLLLAIFHLRSHHLQRSPRKQLLRLREEIALLLLRVVVDVLLEDRDLGVELFLARPFGTFLESARRSVTRIERLRETGIRRIGSPKRGFRYRTAEGRSPGAKDLARIRSLVLPPAWRDVAIAASPTALLQAVGRDAAGRWQYRYSEVHERRRETRKFRRILEFAQALPKMRAAVGRDLALPGLPREKVLACILRTLSKCFLRPGSQVYASENGSYGIATLRNRHVIVKGDVVTYEFPGKSGKVQHAEMRDRASAAIIRKLKKLRGAEVFKYIDPDGKVVDVKRRDINHYIKDVMGEAFSAKDFRTWFGTLVCASELAREGSDPAESRAARRKKMVAAVRKTADSLGNTPSVCRASYIYPYVLESFERGHTIERPSGSIEKLATARRGLRRSERALIRLLRRKAA